MKDKMFVIAILLMLVILGLGLFSNNSLFSTNWALVSVIFLCLVIFIFFWRFEKQNHSAKEISLIATMAALAAVTRVPFAVIPGIQPTTFLVMITGWVFGAHSGFIVGALAALASNFFLGQGPWTPWQMFCWGLGGAVSALLAGQSEGFSLRKFTVLVTFWGYVFGWLMNIWYWVGFIYPLNIKTFLATYAASFPFDTLHVFGNFVICLTFGNTFYYVLLRFKKKITVATIKGEVNL